MLNNELNTAFPWYNKLEKLNRFKYNCQDTCDYKLLAPRDALLPFQLRKEQPEQPTGWQILNANNDVVVSNLSPSLGQIKGKRLAGYDYLYYGGGTLTTTTGALALRTGFYYSKLIFPSKSWYSEMFYIPEVPFYVADTNIPYLKIEWWHSMDLDPFFFQDYGSDTRPIFRNVVYLEAEVIGSEPVITEEGENNGNGELVPDFQKAIIPYKISLFVPDYLKIAIVLMQMHNNVILSTEYGIRSGSLEKLSTSTAMEEDGCFSSVEITYEETVAMIRRGCDSALVPEDCSLGVPPVLSDVIPVIGGVKLIGTGYHAGWIDVTASTTMGGTYITVASNLPVSTLQDGSMFIPSSAYGGRTWFKVVSRNWNCNYGTSPAIENA